MVWGGQRGGGIENAVVVQIAAHGPPVCQHGAANELPTIALWIQLFGNLMQNRIAAMFLILCDHSGKNSMAHCREGLLPSKIITVIISERVPGHASKTDRD